ASLAELFGDEETATKCRKQLGGLRREPMSAQERAQPCHERVQQLDGMLCAELERLEQHQSWVVTRSRAVQHIQGSLLEAGAEYAVAVASLAISVKNSSDTAGMPEEVLLASVVDGKCDVGSLIDFECSFNVGDELELSKGGISEMGARAGQLRAQMQAASKGVFQSSMEKVRQVEIQEVKQLPRLRGQ
ncbi:unnamed protein product, partial [Prorocentrum cordatum]